MQSSDRANFAHLLNGVHDFYGKTLSEFSLSVWWEAMRPFDFAAVKDAMNRHCVNPDNGQFLPRPADVVKLIGGGTQDAALVAWSEVMRAVREQGTYRSVTFADPIINAVIVDMGGWIAIGQIDNDELPFRAKEFENRYRGYRLRGEAPEVRSLLGIADRDNQARGLGTSEPLLIGKRKAIAQKPAELESR